MPGGSHRGCTARSRLTACLPQGPRGGCERGPRCRCRCRPPRRAARSMPLSPAGSKHESPESPPPEPPPPPERQPRASAGEPGSGLREETRLDPIRGPAGPRSPKLAAPARMEEPAPGAIVVRIGIPDLQQTVSARPAPTRTAWLPAPTRPDPTRAALLLAPTRTAPLPAPTHTAPGPAPLRTAPVPETPSPTLPGKLRCAAAGPAGYGVGRTAPGAAALPMLLRSPAPHLPAPAVRRAAQGRTRLRRTLSPLRSGAGSAPPTVRAGGTGLGGRGNGAEGGGGTAPAPAVPRVPGGCCGAAALGMVTDGAGCPGEGTAVRQEDWARVTGRELRWHRASLCVPCGAETERVVLGGQPWSGQKDCSHRGSNEGAVLGQRLARRGQEGLRCLWIGWVLRCSCVRLSAAGSSALRYGLSAPRASPATSAPPPSARSPVHKLRHGGPGPHPAAALLCDTVW